MTTTEIPCLGYFGSGGDTYGELEQALHLGADPSYRVLSDETPLHFCAEMGYHEFVRLLLEAGADANARDQWRHTPLLSTAILDHDTTAAELLLRAGCDPNTPGRRGETPLYWAAKNNCESLARLLLDYGADPTLPTAEGVFPLDVAERAHLRWLLIAAGAEVPPGFPIPPQLRHPHSCHNADTPLLCDAIYNAELQALWGCTPLHLAALSDSESTLCKVLELMPTPSAPDADGRSALYWAVNARRRRAAFMLLDAGAVVDGETLLRAVEQRDALLLRRLLQSADSPELTGTDPTENPHCAAQITALHRAAELGEAGMLRLLLAAGADINARDGMGKTPLLRAVKRHAMPAALMLLEWDADPNVPDEDGNTPLHLAASRADWRLVQLLLEQGANPNLADGSGRVPQQRCDTRHGDTCIRLLEEAQKAPIPDAEDVENGWSSASDEHYTSLADAAARGDLQEVWWRLQDGENPNAPDEHGRTALHHAMTLNYVKTARCLLRHGADPLLEDEQGETPIDGAISHAMRRHGARLRHELRNSSTTAHES